MRLIKTEPLGLIVLVCKCGQNDSAGEINSLRFPFNSIVVSSVHPYVSDSEEKLLPGQLLWWRNLNPEGETESSECKNYFSFG